MTDAPSNVKDLILRSLNTDHFLGRGGSATVFALDLPGAEEDYVLRVSHNGTVRDYADGVYPRNTTYSPSARLKEKLENSTSLTPVKRVLSKAHVGQPLIFLPGEISHDEVRLSIRRREKGINLVEWLVQRGEQYYSQSYENAATLAHADLLHILNQQPEENLRRTLHDLCLSEANSVPWDAGSTGNVMFDEERGLSTIDHRFYDTIPQGAVLESTADTLKEFDHDSRSLFVHLLAAKSLLDASTPENAAYYDRELQTFEARYKAICDEIRDEVQTNSRSELRKPAFKTIKKTEAIALDAPPATLLQALRSIESEAAIGR